MAPVQHGHDPLGALVLGARSLERALADIDQPTAALAPTSAPRYPVLALAAIDDALRRAAAHAAASLHRARQRFG